MFATKSKMNKRDITVAAVLIFLGFLGRILPHPSNFTPIVAIGLFSGFYFSLKFSKFLIPLLSMFLSDMIIGFYDGIWLNYISIIASIYIGTRIPVHKLKISFTLLAACASSLSFFVLSNFGVWLTSGMYPHTLEGLLECYVLAIPFYQNSLAGDCIYSLILFGMYQLYLKPKESMKVSIK
jgi:uncharacterized membrane protein